MNEIGQSSDTQPKIITIHPESIYDYQIAVISNSHFPTVHHSLFELSLSSGLMPTSILAQWNRAQSVWSTFSAAAASLLLFHLWYVAIPLLLVITYLSAKGSKRLNIRLAYFAAMDSNYGEWCLHRGYLSLVRPLDGMSESQVRLSECFVSRARADSYGVANSISLWSGPAMFVVALIVKLVVAILLVIFAFNSWPAISSVLAGLIGTFFLFQTFSRSVGFIARAIVQRPH